MKIVKFSTGFLRLAPTFSSTQSIKNQKSKNSNYLTVLCCIFLLIASCDDMNDIHQKYLDASGRVYLGMTDSLVAVPGVERVKLAWYINADPKLETTVIYWNNRQDSIEKPFVRKQDGTQKDSAIIDKNMDGTSLVEGVYLFELVNKNTCGERSLTATVQGKSYSETWAIDLGLSARTVANFSSSGFDPATQSATVRIAWNDAPNKGCRTKITYKKRSSGEDVTLYVDETATVTTLTDVGNRLEHPDDVLCISSVYAPDGLIDPFETPVQKEQIVYYMASGTRVENTLYDGSNTTFNFEYAKQDKILHLQSTADGNRMITCSRVAELSPLTTTTSFYMNLYEDQSVSVGGYYASETHIITDDESMKSVYYPATRKLALSYRVTTASGYYIVDETLEPKTTPVEKQAAKPYTDKRVSVDVGDYTANTFIRICDNQLNNWAQGPSWLSANWTAPANFPSITFALQEPLRLTRMIVHGEHGNTGQFTFGSLFNPFVVEIWGAAEMDESKDAAYWSWNDDPTGTFKEDWVNLGRHEFERLDLRGWSAALQGQRGAYGHHVIFPETDVPIKYIRYYHHRNPGSGSELFYIGELSFFGYTQ